MTARGTLRHVNLERFDPELVVKLRMIVARDGAEQTVRALGTSQTLLWKALSLGVARPDSVKRLSALISEMS